MASAINVWPLIDENSCTLTDEMKTKNWRNS